MTKTGWCLKCGKLQEKLVVDELFTARGQRQFRLKCPDCGTMTKVIRWGRERTMKYLRGEKVGGQQLSGAIVK